MGCKTLLKYLNKHVIIFGKATSYVVLLYTIFGSKQLVVFLTAAILTSISGSWTGKTITPSTLFANPEKGAKDKSGTHSKFSSSNYIHITGPLFIKTIKGLSNKRK